MKKPVTPSAIYKTTVYHFTFREVTEALGLDIPQNTVCTVTCNGVNQVAVTVEEKESRGSEAGL